MHIILAALGAIVTILILFNRLKDAGIDIGWLNPFSWAHRRRWRKKFNADPAFMLDSPMEVAAGLMYVAAKATGEMTQEERQFILEKFEQDFNLTSSQANDLLSSTSYIIKDEEKVLTQVSDFVASSLSNFSQEQIDSTINLVNQVINLNPSQNIKQLRLLKDMKQAFSLDKPQKESW